MNVKEIFMKHPKLSVITPSFNQARFFEKTIQSVLSQDYPDFEYIVIDGGSTDGSVDIIRKYEDRVAYWVSEPDSGQAQAINKGFARAQGEYVAWLNSDDVYLPGVFSKAVRQLDQHPDASFVYANVVGIDTNEQATDWPNYRQYSLADFLSLRIIGQPSVFMRHKFVEQVGGLDQTYHYLLDHKLWIELSVLGDPVFVDDYWGCARRHKEAKNSCQRTQFILEARKLQHEFQTRVPFHQIMQRYSKMMKAGAAYFEASYLLADGHATKAAANYLQAAILWPQSAVRCSRLFLYAVLCGFGLQGVRALLAPLRKGGPIPRSSSSVPSKTPSP